MYEAIRFNNISTWGPIDEFLQIWYSRFVDSLWAKIQARTCRCQLYDFFVDGARNSGDTVLQQYLENSYDPALCEINDQTMYKWNLFLNRVEIKNRAAKFIRIGDLSLSILHELAKAYLPAARYTFYFEAPPYPLVIYMWAYFTSPPPYEGADVKTYERAQVKMGGTYFNNSFPALNLAGRQDDFLSIFAYYLDMSFTYYRQFKRVPLDPTDDITWYHLTLYFCRKDYLNSKRSQYSSSSTIAICTTPAPPTTTTPPCSPPLNTAEIFVGTGVVLVGTTNFPKAAPVGTCANSANGVTFYYNGSTPKEYNNNEDAVWVGQWIRTNCTSPCICTSTACYTPQPGNPSLDPNIFLYPHCSAPNQCFIAAIFTSEGALVNPSDPADKFNAIDQTIVDVNDSNYPKVISIGCGGCPVAT
uniref:Uncharacterized protein n=1 Tax=Panagrolaimus sp. ES5 TaxID=591445 RepID=A0AC34FFR0_9BILA